MKIKTSKGLAILATCAIAAMAAVAPSGANASDLQTSFVAWGQNSYGQTGNGTTDNVYQPAEVEISGLEAGEKIAQIDADYYNTCAITTLGNLYCWGYNGYGGVATGDENTSEYLTPQKVSFEGKTWKQISVGYDHVCAITTGDELYCWGSNSYGQVGDGTSGSDNYLPALVDTSGALSGKVVKQVAAAGYFTCALTTDNSVSCWGYASYGSIGNNDVGGDDVVSPLDITNSGYLNGKSVKELVPGGYQMCALTTANDVACWGGNDYLETGTASQESAIGVPTQIDLTGTAAGKKFKQVVGGGYHTCGITTDNMILCWGYNEYYTTGLENTDSSPVTEIEDYGSLAGDTFVDLAIGSYHSCALTSEGEVGCWGYHSNSEPYLGIGVDNDLNTWIPQTPVTTDLSGQKVTDIQGSGWVQHIVGMYGTATPTSTKPEVKKALNFESGAIRLTATSKTALNIAVTQIKNFDSVRRVVIRFHIHPKQATYTGKRLAKARAWEIRRLLISKGVDAEIQIVRVERPNIKSPRLNQIVLTVQADGQPN